MAVVVSVSSDVEPHDHPKANVVRLNLDVSLGLVVDHGGDATDADGFLAGQAEGAG